MKKIVIYNGSPRMDGNTVTLLNLVAQGARDNGAEVEFKTLFKMKFMACQSCFYCRMNDDCIIKDELHTALQQVKEADAVVIGSPIYFMQMSGMTKNLYDRFFPLVGQDGAPRFGTKKMATVYSQGLEDEHAYDSYFDYVSSTFPAYGFEWVDNIVCTHANDPESAERNPDLKIRAYELGKKLAR